MKIVKEHINEIKTGQKGSGLSSIGVGNTVVRKGYDIFRKSYPEMLSNLRVIHQFGSDELKYAYELVTEYFVDVKNSIAFIHNDDMTQELIDEMDKLFNDENVIKHEKDFEKPHRTVTANVYICPANGIALLKKTLTPHNKTQKVRTILIYLFKVPKDNNFQLA